ncbi:pantothenate kinase [Pseudomonas sp. ZM23]|uniref:Type III pantothenate kinase n=1 Tax=Pseudomonas triclosanedens TaxID=2961893 RepID=A0ABY6ZZY4_9PSED|nr:pantothenate kinase [Pseudomonas triclosanedens]MCP8467927.1 pantothenate kinase [Pseudomonas triclosanedens]MCP8473899.1 pantothenate kinase [Pseudomonas triclosanedens]MCP8479904.1 pantothenate kinase [Pseudomonas triclosanedens]WAI50296.1 pantothenate kinase [Pseudomonas triclosanedens]
MILELDCGNSLIKWRVVRRHDLVTVAGGVADSDQALLAQLRANESLDIRYCRMVSVRSEQETDALRAGLESAFNVSVQVAAPAQKLEGVANGYREYERLGMDRWLALVAGHCLAGRGCLVIDLGTAVTSDLVDAAGRHMGGYIAPGMPLMRSQLRTHTRRIRYDDDAAHEALQNLMPGQETSEAVERGCVLMLRGFVREQCELACRLLGDDCAVYLTGGDAELVKDELPRAVVLPDLVFIGLALACPIE